MTREAVRPTGVERSYGPDEIIVSKTDLKGRLTYANDVFLRLSAFDEKDVLGQPHSIIRHPEMPRGVFKLLWGTLAEKRELFAYICNLAGDGAHYWVFAHVTPSFDTVGNLVGYHSNRRLPSRRAIDEVTRVYRTLLSEEQKHSRAVDAAAAGMALLNSTLAANGTNYGEWVWNLASASAVAA